MRNRNARGVGIGAAAVAACGGVAIAGRLARSRLQRPPGEPGELIELDGLPLHALAHRRGDGPTVVFENGLVCPCTEWAWVLPEIAGRYNYLAYDRPGTGWSADDGKRRSLHEFNQLTGDLLAQLGLPAPYVLVGHSVGGLLIRSFAAARPHEVAGLVLVDSSHPDQLARSSSQRDLMPMLEHVISTLYWRTLFGRKPAEEIVGDFDDLPPDLATLSKRMMDWPPHWRAGLRELRDFETWCDDLRATTLPKTLPIAVVTAGQTSVGERMHDELQADLTTLTEVSEHVVVAGAGHDDIVMREENAAHIVAAIDWAVARHLAQPQEMRSA